MNVDSVYQLISEMLCDAKDLDESTLTTETPLNQIGLDSLDYVELMVLAKRHFGVTITADTFTQNHAMTLGDLCQHIASAASEQ